MKIIQKMATENGLFSHFPTVTAHVHRFFLWSLKHDIFRQKMRFSTSIVFCCKLALRFMYFHCRDFAYNSKSRLWEDKLLGMQLFNADHAASMTNKFFSAAIFFSHDFPTVVAHILM
jgi:hypothetical protein